MKIAFVLASLIISVCAVTARPSEKTAAVPACLEEGFQNVPQTNRPWCYWWWVNGHADKTTITKDLESIKALGFGGVLMFDARGYNDDNDRFIWMPRPANTFMDGEWQDLVVFSVREAARLGLEFTMNLSSCAGALKGPWPVDADAPKRLVSRQTRIPAGKRWTTKLDSPTSGFFLPVAVFAVRYDGEPIAEDETWRNAGNLLINRWDREKKMKARSAVTTIDLTDRLAADGTLSWDVPEGQWCLLRFGCLLIPGHETDVDVLDRQAVTGHYNRMAGRIMDRLGPLTGTTLTHFYSVSWEGSVPTWTGHFEKEFKKYRGYAVRPHLPVLAGWVCKDKESSDRFLRDYCRTRNEMFLHNFYGTMRDLSHARGVKWYSESGGPWNRAPSVFLEADQQAFLAVNDIPQGEFWLGAAHHSIPHHNRAAVAAAHVYGLRRAAAESFTHMIRHWSAYPSILKARGDEAFLDGVNHMVWHTFTCSPDTFGKPGIEYFAGTHINRNVTWHTQAAPFINYLSRCQYLLQQGLPVADIAVFTGERTYQHWGSYRERAYDTATLEIPAGYPHDVVGLDALCRRARVENRRLVFPDGLSYGLLAVDLDTETLSLSALQRLTDLRAAGLPIVVGTRRPVRASGLYPQHDAEVVRLATAFWNGAETNLASALSAAGVLPDFSGPFPAVHRQIGSTNLYFVAGGGPAEMTFRVSGCRAERWDAVTGLRTALAADPTPDGRTRVTLNLPHKGSVFVVFMPESSSSRTSGSPVPEKGRQISVPGPWSCTFKNAGASKEEPAPRPRAELGDLTASDDARVRYFAGTVTWRTDVTMTAADASAAWLSLGEVRAGVAEVIINGVSCGTAWCPPWKVPVKGRLTAGRNTIEIRFTNTWENRLIGDCSRPPAARVTKSSLHYETCPRDGKNPRKPSYPFFRGYTSRDPLRQNGVLGPVVFCDTPEPDVPARADPLDASLDVNGSLHFGGAQELAFGLVLHGDHWSRRLSPLPKQSGSPLDEMKYQLKDRKEHIANGRLKLTTHADGSLSLFHLLHFQKDTAVKCIVLSAELDIATFAGARWRADTGETGVFPRTFDKIFLFNKAVRRLDLEVPSLRKTLTLSFQKPEVVLLQDDRKWGSRFTIRIGTDRDYVCRKGSVRTLACTFSSTDGPVRPVLQKQTVIRAGENWIPCTVKKDIFSGSALDFSGFGFQDAPAGKYGRLQAVNGRFEFEKRPGVSQRFYGVNLCGTANFPDRAEADRLVTRLVRLGYNTIRLHHYDSACVKGSPDRLTLNPENMARLDYLCAKAIENGLYLTTDLYTSRPVFWRDVGIDRNGVMENNTFKALVALSDPAFENWKTFARNFLTHRNPLTGRTYAEEPALCLISFVNEGHLYMAWGKEVRTSDAAQSAWRTWIAAKKDAGVTFPPACVPDQCAQISVHSLENAAFALFAAEVEEKSARRQAAFLRSLGVRALFTSANCRPQWAPMARTRRACYDYVDDHFYVDHPTFPGEAFHLPSRCDNTNPLFYETFHLARTAFTRMSGMPYTVTEWNFAGPGRYRGMGGVLTGALASLQDWNGLWRFAYSHGIESTRDGVGVPGYFNLSTDPLMQASDRATLCLFLRGDLPPIQKRLALVITPDAVSPKGPAGVLQTPAWRNTAVWNAQVSVAMNAADARGAVCFDLLTCVTNAVPPMMFPTPPGFTVDLTNGCFTLVTPRTCGAFAEEGARTAGPLSIEVSGCPATVWVSALDECPLETSKRILFSHLTDAQGEGTTYADAAMTTLIQWGRGRTLVRNGSVKICLQRTDPDRDVVYALETSGKRLEKIPTEVRDGRLIWTASVAGPFGARMLYEIVRD